MMLDSKNVILLSFKSRITWRLPLSELSPILGSYKGLSILNPVCLQQVKCSVGSVNGINSTLASFPTDSEIVFSTDELAVAVPGRDPDNEAHAASWLASAFLCWVRILCSQYSIDREPTPLLIAQGVWDKEVSIRMPSIPQDPVSFTAGGIWETAITQNAAEQAIRLLNVNRLAPSSLHHMISAIDSIMADDFQSGYVLAATAMESYVSGVLHQSYESKKAEADAPTMRFITIQGTKSETTKKDPIWEFLNKGRPDFKLLLHEKPLYLGLPSVRMADQPLYDRALKLYKTRNDLVHDGVWSNETPTYLPNKKHGVEALKAVADVIRFYGGPELHIPNMVPQFTKIKTAYFKLRPEKV